jgi:hypothetical protein
MTLSSVKRGLISDSMVLGLPGAMAAPVATDANTGSTASIAFTAVSGATSYTVVSSPATTSQTASSSPYTFTGLSSGVAYTFSIAATNSTGQGGFSQPSNSVTLAGATPSVDYLVVAGGGGGGQSNYINRASGGGGAGGFRTATNLSVTTGSAITVTVGAGGAGGVPGLGHGQLGNDSVFSSITSIGGGGGGFAPTPAGTAGGSGGGGDG